MTGNQLREQFLDYFTRKGHTVVASSSLVPHDDPTLLFTNAGMFQFKRVFMGEEQREYSRAVSCQRCVRAGGKHNDLENVGHTARHHTFFEMLGNFSFGDYFKKEAIAFAWEFLTKELGLNPERLWVTIFQDDDEAQALWEAIEDLPKGRIVRLGEKDNFWAMGDTGPCGPCSEIHIDQGIEYGCGSPDCALGCDCDRFLELWNLVFMQFYRSLDGTLTKLPKPSIDTGMGVERVAAVLQGKFNNFDGDLFAPLIGTVERLSGKQYLVHRSDDVAMRVIADHARATAFLVADGVLPSNEGRGYVLRRVMRRAIRFGRTLGLNGPFFGTVCQEVVKTMQASYPQLKDAVQLLAKVTDHEESRFGETLDKGLAMLDEEIDIRKEAIKQSLEVVVAEQEKAMSKLREAVEQSQVSSLSEVVAEQEKAMSKWRAVGIGIAPLKDLEQRIREATNQSLEVEKRRKAIKQSLEVVVAEQEKAMSKLREAVEQSQVSSLSKAMSKEVVAEQIKAMSKEAVAEQEKAMSKWREAVEQINCIKGDSIFKLYDTFGFPKDIVRDVAIERGIGLDDAGFEAAMQQQRDQSRRSWKGKDLDHFSAGLISLLEQGKKTDFVGYTSTQAQSVVEAILDNQGSLASRADCGALVQVFCPQSPFYAESGGQVGDSGTISWPEGAMTVHSTKAVAEGVILHSGTITTGSLSLGQEVLLQVDERRKATALNHTATHLLHAAMQQVLGSHVKQAGSLVRHDRLRFDFTHFSPVTAEEIRAIERLVNREIRRNTPVQTAVLAKEAALAEGATALFGEKYGEAVRVVSIPGFSKELCGGTHTQATGDIGLFKILSESGIAAGVRRIEALTAEAALDWLQKLSTQADDLGRLLSGSFEDALVKVPALLKRQKDLEKEISALSAATADVDSLLAGAVDVGGIKVIAGLLHLDSPKTLREVGDKVRDKMGRAVALLGGEFDGKAALLALVSKDLTQTIKAGELVSAAAALVGGKGGGRPDMAQAGGPLADKLPGTIKAVPDIVAGLLEGK